MRLHRRLPIGTATLVVGLTLGFLVAGCGSTAPPSAPGSVTPSAAAASPTASPEPTVSASPSPPALTVDDVLARMVDPALAFSGDLTGNVAVGAVSVPVTGKLDVAPAGTHFVMTLGMPNGPQTSEQIIVGGKTYSRSSPTAPWFEIPTTKSGAGLGAALARVGSVTDQGMTTRDGKAVHHYATVAGALPASAMGFDKPGISGFSGRIDLYTDDSGKLVAIGLGADWQQMGSSGAPVPTSMSLDIALSDSKPVISAPEQVWVQFKSTRWPYTIGYPAEAKADEGKKATEGDIFAASADEFYGVIQERQPKGVKLSDYVKAYIDATYKQFKAKPESQGDITIDGRPGKVLLYHLKQAGQERYNVVLVTLDGRDGYSIILVANPGEEANANAFADQLLTTFKIGK